MIYKGLIILTSNLTELLTIKDLFDYFTMLFFLKITYEKFVNR